MLVLRRKPDEGLIIEVDGIKIKVVVIKVIGKQVSLGIKAPKEVEIHREEIYRVIHGEEAVSKKG